jgi:hypothetical protein
VYLFVDESQDTERFVLTAVAADDLLSLTMTIGRLRTISRHLQIEVREYHEADLHRDHPRLLTRALEEMAVFKRKNRRPMTRQDLKVIAAYYLKAPLERKGTALAHERLITVYRETFRAVVWALPLAAQEPIDVVCDQFEGCEKLLPDLEAILVGRTTGRVRFADSVVEKPLQLADLAAGTIRRHLGGEGNEGRFRFIAPLLHHLGVVSVKQ